LIVHEVPLLRFLGGVIDPAANSVNPFESLLENFRGREWRRPEPIPGRPEYATEPVNEGGTDQVLLMKGKKGEWIVIGWYVGTTIAINDAYRGRDLSTELILRCSENRPVPERRDLTQAGYDALRRAHRVAIQRAIAAGLTIPLEVQADYLDLFPESKK
jgi:hypothetical protein